MKSLQTSAQANTTVTAPLLHTLEMSLMIWTPRSTDGQQPTCAQMNAHAHSHPLELFLSHLVTGSQSGLSQLLTNSTELDYHQAQAHNTYQFTDLTQITPSTASGDAT